jgi:hypothetical protein
MVIEQLVQAIILLPYVRDMTNKSFSRQYVIFTKIPRRFHRISRQNQG